MTPEKRKEYNDLLDKIIEEVKDDKEKLSKVEQVQLFFNCALDIAICVDKTDFKGISRALHKLKKEMETLKLNCALESGGLNSGTPIINGERIINKNNNQ